VLGATRTVPDTPAPLAIAAVTTVGYLGSFVGPPVLGVLAQASSVPTAMWLLVAVSLLSTLVAGFALRPAHT
jgi:hypothetical protein